MTLNETLAVAIAVEQKKKEIRKELKRAESKIKRFEKSRQASKPS